VNAIVFLGGGRITSALVTGLRRGGYEGPIVVHDRHSAKLGRLKREHGVIAEASLPRALGSAGLLIIAVRPGSVGALLKQIGKEGIRGPITAVSLAAGIPLSQLQTALGQPVRWVRAMPSPVCRSRRGLTALTFGRGLSKRERTKVRSLFARTGDVVEIPEKQFDAFTVTYSCSHGYHALQALIAAAEGIGLNRRIARMAAAHALADGITAWREGDLSLKSLMHEAATPGGIAASVMASLDRAGYGKLVAQGLRTGIHQARRNARR